MDVMTSYYQNVSDNIILKILEIVDEQHLQKVKQMKLKSG